MTPAWYISEMRHVVVTLQNIYLRDAKHNPGFIYDYVAGRNGLLRIDSLTIV